MLELDVHAFFLSHASHVHQTRTVGTCYVFGTRLHVSLHLVLAHLSTDGSFLNREHATETAALVGTLGFYHLTAVDQLQQVANLVELLHMFFRRRRKSQFPDAMARIVQAHLVRECSKSMVHLHHIVQELNYIHAFLGRHALMPGHQPFIVDSHESRTAHRRSHHIVEAFEFLFKLLGQRHSHFLESGVCHRLPATRLTFRIVHV